MNLQDLTALGPWRAAGVGVPLSPEGELAPDVLVRRGFLEDLGDFRFALTARGAVHAARVRLPTPGVDSSEGEGE